MIMWTLAALQDEIRRRYGPSIMVSYDGGQCRLTHGNGRTARFDLPDGDLSADALHSRILGPLIASWGITPNPPLGRQSRPRRLRPSHLTRSPQISNRHKLKCLPRTA